MANWPSNRFAGNHLELLVDFLFGGAAEAYINI